MLQETSATAKALWRLLTRRHMLWETSVTAKALWRLPKRHHRPQQPGDFRDNLMVVETSDGATHVAGDFRSNPIRLWRLPKDRRQPSGLAGTHDCTQSQPGDFHNASQETSAIAEDFQIDDKTSWETSASTMNRRRLLDRLRIAGDFWIDETT